MIVALVELVVEAANKASFQSYFRALPKPRRLKSKIDAGLVEPDSTAM